MSSRRGRIEATEDQSGSKVIKGHVPLSEMFGYTTSLRSKTQGRGAFSMFFDTYEAIPKSVQEKVLSNVDKD